MPPFQRLAAATCLFFVGSAAALAAPVESPAPAEPDAALRSTVQDPPATAAPNEFAPAGDAIPGAQTVKPPPECANGTMRTAIGDVICR